MNTRKVPSLKDALAEAAEFRQARGRRYELLSVLLLCCVAVLCGYRSQAARAEWGANYGRKPLDHLTTGQIRLAVSQLLLAEHERSGNFFNFGKQVRDGDNSERVGVRRKKAA
ncbi:MAG TPA: hypothetical protein VD966_07205 [Pyrinomonadaceae bacterium]|nr:hypothetical protein [Pyrinomonadaceae bacterium]